MIRVKLAESLVNVNSLLTFNSINSRFGFMQTYRHFILMPLVNRNIISFVGMDIKKNYLIWHEAEGKFTALHRLSGLLKTWSLISGKLIPEETRDLKDEIENPGLDFNTLRNYSIYEKNSNDTTYKEGKYI